MAGVTDLAFPGAGMTEIELWKSIEDRTLTPDGFERAVLAVRARQSEVKWLLIGLLAYGKENLGDDELTVLEEIGLSQQYQDNLASVGRRWTYRRRERLREEFGEAVDLPVGFYEATSRRKLDMVDAIDILVHAGNLGWTRDRVRQIVSTILDRENPLGTPDHGGVRIGGWSEYKVKYMTPGAQEILPPDPDPGRLLYSFNLGNVVNEALRGPKPGGGRVYEVVAHGVEKWLETPDGAEWLIQQARRIGVIR